MAQPTLPAQLRNRDAARLRRYDEYLTFYNGTQWPTNNPRRNRRLTLNYARAIIHKATSYLMRGRTTVVEPADPSDAAHERAAAAELALAQVHEQNDTDALDFDSELDCAVLGDGVYKVWWDTAENRVRITAPDPSGIFAWHLPDDPTRIWRVANRYSLDADAASQVLGDTGTLTLSRSNTIIEEWTRDTYTTWLNNNELRTEANTYGFIPFVIFPNLREPKQLWGASDLPPIMDPQRELNRAMTQLSLILELSGNPIAVLEGVTESADIAVQPGAVWELPPAAKAYIIDLLEHGGVSLHIDYINAIYRTLHDLGETPRSAFGEGNTNLSGVALELELDPIVKKVERKRRIRTTAYHDRNDMILSLLDRFAGTSFGLVNHTVEWGSVLPTDRDREVGNEVTLVGAGVHSRRYAADHLGGIDDPDAEFDRWLEEQQRATERSTTNAT